MTIDDWIVAVTSWGISPDIITQVTGQPTPGNLYYEIATRQEQVAKMEDAIYYDTTAFPETDCTYYNSHELSFQATILGRLLHKDTQQPTIVLLNESPFYPTSGGQAHDVGTLTIEDKTYEVVDVQKVGKCILHCLNQPVEERMVGMRVSGKVNQERRD